MKLRPIPHTSLSISPLCLGTMTFGTPVGEADAIRLVHRTLELGINFIDTANSYEGYARVPGSAGGVAEEILGQGLAGRRDRVVLATKAGNPVGSEHTDRGLSRAHLMRELHKSLKRLRTDYVDVFYLHRPEPDIPLEESIAACADLIRAGKTRHWGFSNFTAAQVRQMLAICDAQALPRPVVSQPPLSLLKQDACAELLPLCAKEGIATVPYQVLQNGLLTGKYAGHRIPSNSRAAEKSDWLKLDENTFAALDRLEKEAGDRRMSLMQYAMRWALEQPSVNSLIVGVKEIRQLESLCEAVR